MMKHKLSMYRFDDVLVDLYSFRVVKAGQVLCLEPKAFEVLILLIENAGRMISKELLLDSVWTNSFVTPNAMTRVIAQLRKALGDRRKEPKYIQTIQTRGYRFIAEVEKIDELVPAREQTAFSHAFPEAHCTAKSVPSLAILPLKNLSADLQSEWFTEGLTDELITEIAKLKSLRVVSRTSVMQYKTIQRSLPQIARELNADVILEGSVLQIGNRVRITAQLIRGEDDQHLWADSYERTINDVFALQKEISRSILVQVCASVLPRSAEISSNLTTGFSS